MPLTSLQSAIWTLLMLTSGQFDYVPMRGTLNVMSDDGGSVVMARAGVHLGANGRCLFYMQVDEHGVDRTPDDVRLHELAHIVDCLDNRALDGSPMPAGADQAIIPNVPGCQRNAAERFACWYVANVDRTLPPPPRNAQ